MTLPVECATVRLGRRRLLGAAGSVAALLATAPVSCTWERQGFTASSDPFTLGVASGDPLPDGVVLWTRLAPDPLAGGGMPARRVPVDWELAADESFRRVLRRGAATADPFFAHSVHVEVDGLATQDEWNEFVGSERPYVRTCLDLPSGYGALADAPAATYHLG